MGSNSPYAATSKAVRRMEECLSVAVQLRVNTRPTRLQRPTMTPEEIAESWACVDRATAAWSWDTVAADD